jgi:very-short-patch-repair endonuclease
MWRLTQAQLESIRARSKAVKIRFPENHPPQFKHLARKYNNEELLQNIIKAAGLPVPVREYRFLPDRRFRFDLAWPGVHLAVEINGQVHRIKKRFLSDIEKMNLAREAGWQVVQVTPSMVRSGEALELCRRALDLAGTRPVEMLKFPYPSK